MSKINNVYLKDNIAKRDVLIPGFNKTFRTEVDAYDQFGNILFSKRQNTVVIGGAIYILEKLFGIRSALQINDLNSIIGINTDKDPFTTTEAIPKTHTICLWGAGIGGSGDSIGSTRKVNFFEREIGSKGKSYEMIPFRFTESELSAADKEKYWFKKTIENKTAYYLKSFKSTPVIKAYFDDGINGADGTEVTSEVYNTSMLSNIVVFIELKLQISPEDFVEYFNFLEDSSNARINTIALCTGVKVPINEDATEFDYSNVLMFSKLHFNNIPLENLTDEGINFRYRIYTN